MPEIKHNFTAGKMNKDLDERLIPNGEYRDAMNVQVSTSEGSDVGTVQNILGNSLIDNNLNNGQVPDGSYCVGSVSDEKTDAVYWLVSGPVLSGDLFSLPDISTTYDYILRHKTSGGRWDPSQPLDYVLVDEKAKILKVVTGLSGMNPNTSFIPLLTQAAAMSVNVGDVVSYVLDDGGTQYPGGTITSVSTTAPYGVTLDSFFPSSPLANALPGQPGLVLVFESGALKFSSNNLITGINVIDDMLFWTDDCYEPKKINIPRCIEGTNPTGTQRTFFINEARDITVTLNPTPIREEHITVIKKAPLIAPALKMVAERPGNTYGRTTSSGVLPNFPALSTGDTVTIDVESLAGTAGLNYKEGDVLFLKQNIHLPVNFPIPKPDVRVVIKTIQVFPLYISITCTILSIANNVSIATTVYGVDLDTSYEKLYELKFPRFSTRFKYIDGEYSSFGPFSEVAFIPGVYDYFPNKGYNLGMENNLRELILKRIVPTSLPDGVVQIDILYKESNSPNIYLVDSIKQTDPWGVRGGNYWTFNEYKITKDIIHAALPSNQLLRLWDNVPRKALAQDIIGNRIVYGNYLQGFNLLDDTNREIKASFNVSLENRSDNTFKSIKSLRNYQLGVVYSDEYNRQTPILTDSSGTLAVSKLDSDKSNHIAVVQENNPPEWAKYYKFYVKEPSNEYYNLSLDRYFDAEDGNVWLSFPSNEINKVDLDTSLYLKKRYNSSTQETHPGKYKILDIKKEAPEYIKTRRVSLGTVNNGTGDSVFDPADNPPILNKGTIMVKAAALANTILENFHLRQTELHGNVVPGRPLYVKLTNANAAGEALGADTGWHEVDNIKRKGALQEGTVTIQVGTDYIIKLKTNLGHVDPSLADWLNQGTVASPVLSDEDSEGNIVLHIGQDSVQNRSVFQGRFFVKILKDEFIQESIIFQGAFQNVQVIAKANCHHVKDFTHEDIADTSSAFYAGTSPPTKGDHSAEITSFNTTGTINPVLSSGWTGYGLQSYQLEAVGDFQEPGNSLALPDGKPVPLDAYWSREIWYEIYERLKKKESMWFIDEAFSSGEEPLWGGYQYQKGMEFIGFTNYGTFSGQLNRTSTLYGGYHNLSSNNDTRDHNLECGNTSTISLLSWLVKNQNYPDLCHGTNYNDYEYFSTGTGVQDFTIDISYLGPGDIPGAGDDYADANDGPAGNIGGISLHPSVYSNHVPDYAHLWGIGYSMDLKARKFANNLVAGSQLRFTNDPDQIVYTIKTALKLYKLNYAEAEKDVFYPFSNSINVESYCDSNFTPGTSAHDSCLEHSYEFWNNAPWNRRLTYRLTLEPADPSGVLSGNIIGYNGYTPLVGNTLNGVSWGTPGVGNDDPCPIEIVTTNYIEDIDVPFPENPAVFETQPKDNVDLDLYHEISDYIPLTLDGNGYEFAPIGSKVTVPTSSGGLGPAVVVSWDGDVVELSSVANECFLGQYQLFYFERPDGAYTTAKYHSLVNAVSGPCDTSFFVKFYDVGSHKIYNNKVGLGWHNCYSFGNGVESNRIRDTYNSPIVDKGPRVSSILEKAYTEDRRKYGLIYSGLYNSISDMNNLNQFIQAEKITKDINPIYGSIQKLHARDTDLVTLCEDKILRVLANKDAVYNADGNTNLTATEKVLGQTIPFVGEFGISKNPESFTSEAYRSYFTDKQRGTVMRLSRDGLTPISMHGMKDWFKDNLKLSDKLIGSYDDRNEEYNITIKDIEKTVSFKEEVRGWTSFKSFVPENAISCANDYFTILDGKLYKHYDDNVDRNTFYGNYTDSSVNVILNESPGSVKSFHTLDYEGSQSQVIPMVVYDGEVVVNDQLVLGNELLENQYYNLTPKDGWYVDSFVTDLENGSLDEFIEKEGKWFNYLRGESITTSGGYVKDNYDTSSFAVQGIGFASSINISSTTPSWDCVDQLCVDPGTGLGQYSSIAACQAAGCLPSCIVQHATISLVGGPNVIATFNYITPFWQPGDTLYYWIDSVTLNTNILPNTNLTGASTQSTSLTTPQFSVIVPTPTTIQINVSHTHANGITRVCTTQATVIPYPDEGEVAIIPETWDCINGACIDPENGLGAYDSLSACQTACGDFIPSNNQSD